MYEIKASSHFNGYENANENNHFYKSVSGLRRVK